MDWANVAMLIVTLITGAATIASARTNAKATVSTARTDAETEAYERARRMDLATIERQDAEIEDLRFDNRKKDERIKSLETEVKTLKRRFDNLVEISPTIERLLRERLEEPEEAGDQEEQHDE